MVKLETTRWVPKATRGKRGRRALNPPPLSHHRRHNRCPCGECCVRRGFNTPGKGSFRAKAAFAVKLLVKELHGGAGYGARCRNRTVVWHNRRQMGIPAFTYGVGHRWVSAWAGIAGERPGGKYLELGVKCLVGGEGCCPVLLLVRYWGKERTSGKES